MKRNFESWFDEMRTIREFRQEYERYFHASRKAGVKPETPKSWAYDCFEAVEDERQARAVMAREARSAKRRVREVTSAIVKYEDYPT